MSFTEVMLAQPDADAVRLLKAKLMVDNDWLRRAIVAIFEQQTSDEQRTEQTREHNNRGFNGVDAELMTSFAKQVLRGSMLSEKQLSIARRKMLKYAGQLLKLARKKS